MNDRATLYADENGILTVGGCKATSLAKEFGTPLYVFDERHIRDMMGTYREAIDEFYDGNGLVLYASKAFCCEAMYHIANVEGIGADVVSGGELFTASCAGFPSDKIYMHGNSKSYEELRMAVDEKIGSVVIDCIEEAEVLDSLASDRGMTQSVLIRVNPGIEAHTHAYVQTATPDSKFGFSVASGAAEDFTKRVLGYKNLKLKGFHCHIGSQIFETESFRLAADRMMDFMAKIRDDTGFVSEVMDLGGGFGIWYVENDPKMKPADYKKYVKAIADCIKNKAKELDIPEPYLIIEPGRSIVGEAGITLYTVETVKDIPGVRRYVAVDGGMGDNPRHALYQSEYTVLRADKADATPEQTVSIAGKCCESGDIIASDVKMPNVSRGDIIAVLSTGAYNYSMASNYNRNCIPAAVLVCGGKVETIVRRQDYSDLVRLDVVPERLER